MQGLPNPPTQRGIIPRAFEHVFESVQVRALGGQGQGQGSAGARGAGSQSTSDSGMNQSLYSTDGRRQALVFRI